MGAATVNIKIQDRSTIIPSLDGIYGIINLPSTKGEVGQPTLVTSGTEFLAKYDIPKPSLGVGHYSALNYLTNSNKLWVNRVVGLGAKFSAILVKGKVNSVPLSIPDGSYVADLITQPVVNGLSQSELETFSFNLYSTNRIYDELLTDSIRTDTENSSTFTISSLDNVTVGDKLSFGTSVDDASYLYEIQSAEIVDINYDLVKLGSTATASIGDEIVRVNKLVQAFSSPIAVTVDGIAGSDTVEVNSVSGLMSGSFISINSVEYLITSLNSATGFSISPVLSEAIVNSDEVFSVTKSALHYADRPTVIRAVSGSSDILVSNSDSIGNGDIVTIGTGSVEFVIADKTILSESQNVVVIDNPISLSKTTQIWKLVQSEFEERECFLISILNQGVWGDKISIGITPSTNYDFAFNILVYSSGVLSETWEVTRQDFIDGNGRQMYIEDKINGSSEYITVLDNKSYVDQDEIPVLPLNTDYSIWRKNSEDIFNIVTSSTLEDVVLNDVEIKVSDNSIFTLGDRVKFDGFDSEYKIYDKTSQTVSGAVESFIILDRIVQDTLIQMGTQLRRFDNTLNSPSSGIYSGIQYFSISKLDKVYYNYKVPTSFTIASMLGTLHDAGVNLASGGNDGERITVSDLILGIQLFNNKDEFPGQIILDAGFAVPAYAQAIDAVVKARGGNCHGYLTSPIEAELSVNYKQAIADYAASTMLNSENVSLFCGWVKVQDPYNSKQVYVSPEGFAAASQLFTTNNYAIFYPAAGWLRGKVNGGLGLLRNFSSGDLDWLVDNKLNPIKYEKGNGMVIWGNVTMYSKPSPLQLRSVAFLLIYIKHGLDGFLKYINFDINDRSTWSAVEGAIDTFMRDQVYSKRGVYDYKVAVSSVITDSDIDNRHLPIYLGIQPTLDIKTIDATIAIFNKSAEITIG